MNTTPDLSREFHPVPKAAPKAKKTPQPIGIGKKTQNWNDGREQLKKIFAAWGITNCEIRLDIGNEPGCMRDNFLGFAHTERRNNLTPEDVRSPKKVVLACQYCHHIVDFIMDRKEAKKLLEEIIARREQNL